MQKINFFLTCVAILSFSSISIYSSNKLSIFERFQKECSLNSRYLKKFVSKKISTDCNENYHHYNSKAFDRYYSYRKTLKKSEIKVGTWNVLKPGNKNSYFKDYKLVADYIQKYQIISITELITNSQDDFAHNLGLIDMNDNSMELIKLIEESGHLSAQQKQKLGTEIRTHSRFMNNNQQKLYRVPGYLKILNELNSRTKKKYWSLILSSRPDGNEERVGTMELVGVIYDSRYARPTNQQYCQKVKGVKTKPYGCYVDFTPPLFKKDFSEYIQRRPFLTAFRSGKFKFNMLASHISFQEKGTKEDRKKFFEDILGDLSEEEKAPFRKSVTTLKKVKRTGEIYLTLQAIRKIINNTSPTMQAFMWSGDWNFEKKDSFWKIPAALEDDEVILIDAPTSLSLKRNMKSGIVDGEEPTKRSSLSKNYDHIFLNGKNRINQRCHTPQVFDFTHFGDFKGIPFEEEFTTSSKLINNFKSNYVLAGTPKEMSPKIILTTSQRSQVEDTKKYFENDLSMKYQITPRKIKIEQDITTTYYRLKDTSAKFNKNYLLNLENIFATQFNKNNNMRIYLKFLSDHLPVMVTCSTK
ncbi:hypothetical protein N9N67_01345 [Bacteriovoracaceae bacterium]|nr:hypothetical protein [Bacteriovoracaceae bacterium]